ncbi:hypothetical protein BV505_11975, partial [Thermomonas haemolytica]
MTFTNAKQMQPVRRHLPSRALAVALALGLATVGAGSMSSPAHAAGIGQSATGGMADPAKRLPDAVSVSAIDFKRGDGG